MTAKTTNLAALRTSAAPGLDTAYQSLSVDDFYTPAHRMIWGAISSLYDAEVIVDLVTLQNKLREDGFLEQVGPTFLAELVCDYAPPVITEHIRILTESNKKRKVAKAAARLHAAACDPMCSPDQLATLATDATNATEATSRNTLQQDATGLATVGIENTPAKSSWGSVAAKVDRFIKSNPGVPFSMNEVYQACDANDGKTKTSIRSQISRLLQLSTLIRERSNTYLYLENSYKRVSVLDRLHEPRSEFPLQLPLGLHQLCKVHPKNIVVVAGQPSAGKTAFLFDIARQNIGHDSGRPNYLMAEMGEDELADRLRDMPEEVATEMAGGIDFVECESRFDHFIKMNAKDGLSICDYLKADGDSFLYVSQWLDDIHLALDKGLAVVAIQKMAGKSHGVGGGHTESKPRLYITLDKFESPQGMLYKAKIIKAKFPRHKVNLDGMECLYNIHDGWEIEKIGKWSRLDQKGWEQVAGEYWGSNGSEKPF